MLWVRYVHVAAVLAFFLVHGATAMVLYRLWARRDRLAVEDMRALLRLSSSTFRWVRIIVAVFAVLGLTAAFVEGWIAAGRLWPWVAIVTLAVIVAVMHFVAAPLVREIRALIDAILSPPAEPAGPIQAPPPGKWLSENIRRQAEAEAAAAAAASRPSPAQLRTQLTGLLAEPRVYLVPAVGVMGSLFMLFLMVLDPF